ncbi:MAG TPA: S8 family serine peptidase [Flavisolibacter sp.]|nr:S8 family serine peptidase [Flavisolibacter sp.]
MKYHRQLLVALLIISTNLFAQTILLRSGSFQPAPNLRKEVVDSFNTAAKRVAGQAFAVVQFGRIPSAAEQRLLLAAGITLLDYLPQNAYTVSFSGTVSVNTLLSAGAKSIFQLSAQQKMQDYFAKGIIPSWAVKTPGTVDVWISFPKTLPATNVITQLKAVNVDILSDKNRQYGVLALRIASNRIQEIASLPFVEYIQPAPPADQPLNYNSRTGSRATALNASVADGGRALNGEGVVVGVGDNADVQNHVDFSGRLINRNALPFNAHGVHVTGTVGGAGNIDERYRGYAPKATIVSQGFSGVLDNAATYVNEYGMVISNNSYGNIIECDYHGTYDLSSRIMDQQALDLPNLLHVFSAGNSGGNVCAPYPQGFHTVIGGYQSAKNVVTVGATTDSGAIAFFSSRGPVKDGRLKPEIVAMGQGVISTWPTNIYSSNNGTSMSAPAVSGGLALLYQRYRQLNGGANPANGLMKALLCNGGMDRDVSGPDYRYGFGWMNLLRSVEAIEATRYFTANSAASATTTHTVAVPAGTAQLKVLLYWNDLPAALVSAKALVNDLDLEVTTPSATIVLPQILDTSNLNAVANTGADHLNNIEQVVINNPAAGNYTFTVKGTTVTNTQQQYFLVWDAVPTGLKLTAPAGGQALVPGESTKISWDAYGLAGAAALEFSPDGGSSWSTINASVDANRAIYTWVVPSVATNNALVRITKASTGETSVSAPFTIIGQPVLSLSSVQCEGYVAIGWTTVADATDYEVMLLRGDEMKRIAITTSNNYIFNGLSKDSVFWITVRARINGKAGRRAYAISRQPNSGSCAGTISDNDIKVEAIVAPVSGRLFTSTQLSATQAVTVRIKNLDDAAVNNFAVSYTVNGSTVTETVSSIAANATLDYTFTATANLSAPGAYVIIASVRNTPDVVTANDSLTLVVKQLNNQPLNLTTTFVDDLETAAVAIYEKDTIGFTGIDRYDFARSTAFGRARTFVNTGVAYSGSRAITLDASRYVAGGSTSYLLGTFNLNNYTTASNNVRLDFQFLNHGQPPNAANRVWVRGSDAQPWIEAYNLDADDYLEGVYKKARSIDVSALLAAAGQNFTPSFGVRWGQWGQFQTTDRFSAAGYTFDDIRLYEVFNDIELVSIDSPTANSCGLTNVTALTVTVRNSSSTTQTNIPVYYRINGGAPVMETIASIAPQTAVQYTFSTLPNFSAQGANDIYVYIGYSADSFKENDTATAVVYNQPVVASFPYLQNFEGNDGYFYTGGRRSTWAYGTPASLKIRGAASGAKAWKTRLDASYNDSETSYLYSPCFDVSGLTAPTLSFSLALDIEDCGTTLCDGAWVEYSADGETWTKLGTAGTGTNWYNKASTQQVWSIQNYQYWHVATQALPAGLSRLRLRFVFASDAGVARDGIAIDDIHIYDNTAGIYDGLTTAPINKIVNGNNWIDFTSGGKLVASMQPSGAALGSTDVQAHINTGAVRFTTNQYYHNRNITIKPSSTSLPDSVTVRFYFLDSESEALLNATGCTSCNKPQSAYALGVSKYTDANKANENGTIADNSGGVWQFIPPVQITKVPFDKGYYAEFKVAGFSEFWLTAGGLNNLTPLPVRLLDFTAVKDGSNATVKWKVSGETDVRRYEVEVAKGNAAQAANQFVKLGEVQSAGNTSGTGQYSFADMDTEKAGARYYRLKIVNTSGSFRYSDVRALFFGDAVIWQVYPNPSAGQFNLVYQVNVGERLTAKLYDAKGSMVKEYRSAANGFLQKLNIDISANNYANGMYLLQVESTEMKQSFKLHKQ